MAKITNLQALLVHALQDLHNAERLLVVALSRFSGVAHDESLSSLFNSHVAETRGQLDRIVRALTLMLAEPVATGAAAIREMIGATERRIREHLTPALRDAALLAHAQKIEHFEIASYTSALRIADILEYHELAGLLRATIAEEQATMARLTQLSKSIGSRARADSGAALATGAASVLPLPAFDALLAVRGSQRSARRSAKFNLAAADFSGTRQPRRRPARSVKRKRKLKQKRTTRAKRSAPKPRAKANAKRPASRRKRSRRTDD